MTRRAHHLLRDLLIIVFSIFLAIFFAKTGTLEGVLTVTHGWRFVGSFLAGIFFVSIFTAAPASVILVEIAQKNSIFEVALFAAFGAVVGDLLIFRFIKDGLSEDITYLLKKNHNSRLKKIFHLKLFRWLIPFLGALVVASPLPDELGLAMMGFSKMRMSFFLPLSFILNFLGILVIMLIAS